MNDSFAFQRGTMTVPRWWLVPAFVCLTETIAGAQSTTLTLTEALARAREQAPQVLIARARIEETRGRLAGARVRYRDNPTIEGSAGPRSTETGTLTDVDVGIAQVFETGGQRAARIAGAEAAIRRETAIASDVTRLALRDVALAWARMRHAQERLTLLTAAEGVAAEVVTVANRRYSAGDVAVLDVNVAKSALARARALRLAAEADRAAAASQLQRLLGLPRTTSPIADGPLRVVARSDLPALLAAVENRPDLEAMRAEIAEAEADVRLGRAAKSPDLGIGGRFKHEEGHRAVIGELTLTLPVFSRGQELLTTGVARASRLRIELETVRGAALAEVENLYATQATRQAAVDVLERDALAGLDDNERLTQRSFDVGQISLPELLLIRRELLDSRLDYVERSLEASEAAIEQDAVAGVLQ
jgi:outer membrane protein, heavy metal efflux system